MLLILPMDSKHRKWNVNITPTATIVCIMDNSITAILERPDRRNMMDRMKHDQVCRTDLYQPLHLPGRMSGNEPTPLIVLTMIGNPLGSQAQLRRRNPRRGTTRLKLRNRASLEL